MTDFLHDPIALSQALIRQPTVNPCHDGAQDVLADALESIGFRTKRYHFDGVDNLYARLGGASPNFCFAGHTDVVPVGDAAGWTVDPFGAEIRDGIMYGRGTSDMKGAIAAFVSATARYLADHGAPQGSISLLITGDEEGPGLHGTRRLLPAVIADGEVIDHCIVGEPTSEDVIADIVKNGRRGSLNAVIKAVGKQGHAAYPEKSANPMPVLLDALQKLRDMKLDDGSPGFQPSNLEITTIDVGNAAHNVIPASATAKFNIRFNPNHTGAQLMERISKLISTTERGVTVTVDQRVTGEAFYTQPGKLTDIIVSAVKAETGREPALTTGGGTSDARYIKDVCPVAELGVRNEMAHKVDECIPVDEIETLCRIYYRLLASYFAAA
ncbi:MAG TPA: succinyl-diaminopimelate desuccinylase [Hyphomonadaceae bacterium]|nr:succinyl-diaminopimelate desuccinylase [Hyphomonadaceae bacterium]HPI49456.1 succinyl-diaminopimelate desuccinylase [Hyphomonadaceae bacterium]